MIRKAIIPAAGYGTRLLPITKILPKVMIPLLTKPALQYIVEELVSAGISEILIVIGWKGDIIQEYYQRDPVEMIDWLRARGREDLITYIKSIIPKECRIMFKIQEVLDGLAGAILRGSYFLQSESFVVSLGDNVIIEDNVGSLIRDMIKVHETYNSAVTLCVAEVPKKEVSKFGVIGFSKSFEMNGIKVYEVTKVVEKPPPDKAPSNLAIVGRYILSTDSLKYLRNAPIVKGELSETDAFQNMINDGYKVFAVNIGNRHWHDIGSPEGYIKAFLDIAINYEKHLKPIIRNWLQDKILNLD